MAILLATTVACKETKVTRADGDEAGHVQPRRPEPTPEFYASDAAAIQKTADFFFVAWNDSFTRRLDDLPATGEVPDNKKPYSGGYYAEGDGGTDQVMVGGKSPLAKYDDAFYGGDNRAAAWERSKHNSNVEWAGHCNGYSAGAQRNPQEPSRSVVRNGVTFAPQDIKALIAEVYMSADYEFLGGNRCDDATYESYNTALPTPANRQDPTVMGDCEDVNPGTFHAVLGNWIGRMHHTIIMDSFGGYQIWNYPLYKYQVISKQYVTAAQAAQYVTGGNTYKFNPSAAKFAYVHTVITYAAALRQEVLGQLYPKTMDLTYILEMDAGGEIIGGEWTGSSQAAHPDFLWVALAPQQPNGTRFMGNQYVDANEVFKLWAESTGQDPNNPPTDITRPLASNDWGKWSGFQATLDGNTQGTVFDGKQTVLHIKRNDSLKGAGYALDVALNGQALKTVTTTGDEDIRLAFDVGVGLNRLQLTWKKNGSIVEDESLRFHVVR